VTDNAPYYQQLPSNQRLHSADNVAVHWLKSHGLLMHMMTMTMTTTTITT